MKKQKWEKIGAVAVDSGSVLILDPGQLQSLIPKAETEIEAWYLKFVCTKWSRDKPIRTKFRSKSVPLGHLVEAGYGDGLYDIEVRKNSEGRIAELRIQFIDDEE